MQYSVRFILNLTTISYVTYTGLLLTFVNYIKAHENLFTKDCKNHLFHLMLLVDYWSNKNMHGVINSAYTPNHVCHFYILLSHSNRISQKGV